MKYILAIDPDVERSGVAFLDHETKRTDVQGLSFPMLMDYLISNKHHKQFFTVVVEAGWLNKSNWHLNYKDSKQLIAAKGNSVGRNHETGRKIIEMAKHYGYKVVEIKPMKTIWKAGKISHEEISRFIPDFPKRSNQDVRDAALIAWIFAGFSIKI